MPSHAPRPFLICYDIANPRRIGRIHSHLKRHALPLQYSVYYYHASEHQLQLRLQELRALMDEHADDIRALRLHLGPGSLPEGINYAPLPTDWRKPAPPPVTQRSGAWYIS